MNWKDWIGKRVFIKLADGSFFSRSEVLAYEEPFFSLTDKFGYPVIINVNQITKITLDDHEDK